MSGKTVKSTKWFIRIDGPHEFLKEKYNAVVGWIDHNSSSIGYHLGERKDNPHCHIVLSLRTELQKQSLATRIKTLFDVKTKGAYAVEVWDGDLKVYSYLHHESEAEVNFAHAKLTDEEQAKIKTLCEVYKDITTQAKEKASHKCVLAALEAIASSKRVWGTLEIIKFILQGVRDGKWYSPGYRMDNLVDEIYLKQGTDEQAYNNVERLAMKYYQRYDRDGFTRACED